MIQLLKKLISLLEKLKTGFKQVWTRLINFFKTKALKLKVTFWSTLAALVATMMSSLEKLYHKLTKK